MIPTLTWDQAETGLAEHWGSFQPRPQQRAFAHAITETLHGNSKHKTRLAQAGVGCGKSLGYLTPAIASGKRVVVAVSTKALQDQLYTKDLPTLQKALFPDLRYAVLKGRSNYVCLRAAEKSGANSTVHAMSMGERSDLIVQPTDEQWREMSTDADGCVGRKRCPFADDCYSERAKRLALDAQVLVVNTSLLTQHLRMAAMTKGKVLLLGEFDVLIVDEAHEMPEIVSGGLATQVTLRRIMDTTGKLAYHLDGQDTAQQVEHVNTLAARYFNGLKDWFGQQKDARTADLADDDQKTVGEIVDAMQPLVEKVSRAACNCEPMIDPETGEEDLKCEYARRVSTLMSDLVLFAAEEPGADVVWAEVVGRQGAVALKSAPAEVGGWLRAVLWEPEFEEPKTAVLTSATLGIGGDFAYIARRLGIKAFDDTDVGTPFDYAKQGMLYLPPMSAPSPKQGKVWKLWAQDQMFELVCAAGGGALLLFTSTTAMREAYEALHTRLRRKGMNCYLQGDADNRLTAQRFAADIDGVLFATRSFMTGVDFQGETCRLVVVDKMPFPVPEDPVFKARCAAVEERFGERSSFSRVSLPDMSLVLVQGLGRLIRSVDDWGVAAVLDPRMRAGWAAPIRRSLPKMADASTIDQVIEFYQDHRAAV